MWLASVLWMGLGLIAALLSIWSGTSVALIEVFIGAIAANSIGLNAAPLIDYLGGLGAILLAFLAGTEIRWAAVRERALANFAIGATPFVSVFLFTPIVAGWSGQQAFIGAIALSTTSVALVYTVTSNRATDGPSLC